MKLKPVKGYNSFQIIYHSGDRFKYKSVLAVFSEKRKLSHINNIDPDEREIIYYGVAAGKRIARKAVTRNRIKRLLRESLRIICNEIDIIDFKYDVILLHWLAPISHPKLISLNDVLPIVRELFSKAEKFNHS